MREPNNKNSKHNPECWVKSWEIHSNCKILEKYNFDVRYEEIGNEYKITTDIISCWYNLNEKADKLNAAKRSNKI